MVTFAEFARKQPKQKDNRDAEILFDYLAQPRSIHNMIVFSEVGLPALSGLAQGLEKDFGECEQFPLSDFRNRQLVGKMVKFILAFYGYTPVAKGIDERARLREFSKAAYFKTAAVYSQKEMPKRRLLFLEQEL